MPHLLEVADLCSRPLSDPANRLRKTRKKKSSAVPMFRSGHMSAICTRLGSKGKVGVQRGRKTAGCPSFLPTAVGTASSPPRGAARSRRPQTANPPAEVQRKTFRPERANTLTQFVCPGQPVQKRSRPERANPLSQFAHPGFSVQKRSRPVRANPPAAVRAPRLSGAEKEPPVRGEPACGSSCPRRVGAENPGNPEKIFPPEKAAKTPVLTLRKRLSERHS